MNAANGLVLVPVVDVGLNMVDLCTCADGSACHRLPSVRREAHGKRSAI